MRPRVIVVVLLAACGGSTVEAPPLTMPASFGGEGEDQVQTGFAVEPDAPYARLFESGARWTLPTKTWIGAGPQPAVTCDVSGVQRFPAAVVATLDCTASQDLGPVASALPGYGVVATDDGLWITSNAGVIEPAPVTEDELTTLMARHPMRLAAKPAPIHDSRIVDQPGTRPIRVQATIDAISRGDTWCLSEENTAGTETVSSVLCMNAKDGLVGGLAAYRSQGILLSALGWGDAPAPAPSGPFRLDVAAEPEPVTLVSPGKGKRAVVELVAAVGAEQDVTYVIDGSTRSETTGKGASKPVEQPHPTMTLRGTGRVEALEPDGSYRYRFTLASIAASGPTATPQLAEQLESVHGMIYEAIVGRDGQVLRRAVRVDHPTPTTPSVVAQLVQSMSAFTVLPKEPVGVGALWTSRSPGQVLDHDVEIVVTSRLSARKGPRAVVVSEVSVVPFTQAVPRGTATVSAQGTATMQTVTGALMPTRTYEFGLAVAVEPDDAAKPRERRTLLVRTRVLPR